MISWSRVGEWVDSKSSRRIGWIGGEGGTPLAQPFLYSLASRQNGVGEGPFVSYVTLHNIDAHPDFRRELRIRVVKEGQI